MPLLHDMPTFAHKESEQLCISLTNKLVRMTSLNDFMEEALPWIGRIFGTSKVILVDYREQTDRFVLLHFEGYAPEAHYGLQRKMYAMDLRQALRTAQPYHSATEPRLLCVPLYLREILEAVLVLEGDSPIELSESRLETSRVASKFLGLFMSSTRLEVNRDQLIDSQDLQKARQVQLSYLPSDYPRSDAYEIYGYNKSSTLVGGDYFDYFQVRQHSLQCVLADAVGHGMAAALIMSTFRGLLQAEIGRQGDFQGLFDCINKSVHAADGMIQYLTGVFLDFDERAKTLRYFNAGHYDPLIVARDGCFRTLPGGGPPLGMFKASQYAFHTSQMQSGDLLVLFTDGLVDVQNEAGDYFGTDTIVEVLESCHHQPLAKITHQVLDRACLFCAEAGFEDDVTFFVMRFF